MEIINSAHLSEDDMFDLSELFMELTGANQNFEKMKKNLEIIQENHLYHLLCAKVNNKIVGSLMGIICHDLVGECHPFMVIENVIVSPKYQRCNIGKMLMSEIERIGKSMNCHYAMFVSSATRKAAHSFYESIGYDINSVQGFKKFL